MIAFDVWYVLNLFMCAQTWAIIAQMLIYVYTLCVSIDVPGVPKKGKTTTTSKSHKSVKNLRNWTLQKPKALEHWSSIRTAGVLVWETFLNHHHPSIWIYSYLLRFLINVNILVYLHNPLCTYILYIHPFIHL